MSARRRDLIGYLCGLAVGLVGLFAFGFVDLWLDRYLLANDFSGIWAGPRAQILGRDPYDPATWRATATALQAQDPQTAVYGYPGYILLALLPLALLPLPAAAIVWAVGGIALAAVALGALLRRVAAGLPVLHGLFGATLLLSQPGFTSFYDGQWSFVLVAATSGLVLAIGRGAGLATGALLTVLLAKPHLFLLAIPALARAAVARGAGKAIPAFIGIGLVLVTASLVAAPGWPQAFLTYSGAPRFASARVTTLPVALGDLLGPAGGLLALGLIAGAVVVATRFHAGRDAYLAVWLGVSFLAAPYAWSYDQLVLLTPLAITTGLVAAHDRRRALLVAASGCAALLLGGLLLHGLAAEARASESLNALVGAAVLAIVLVGCWPDRR